MGFEFNSDNFADIILDPVLRRTIANRATKLYRNYVLHQPMLSGQIRGEEDKEYIGWDNHSGEYDTHRGYLVEINEHV